ncbi:lysophospholipase [Brenneria izbisi]|uniref:Lysophospholipase n=1 Tax=Brenneria izbisi TaxID=2939450 RepID=A0AA41Y139_9GAMM|nr:lysophospholipase [Brenneria izbisi]MCV9877501.1 lysophospholipase [Brenneria izbisi]MCV9880933.1 lysophospholipase [Brenneria izbisi]
MTISKEVDFFNTEQHKLAIHKWLPDDIRGIIYYFHGLQSHGGWLWEAGRVFASKGIAFVCIDRPGSGLSSGDRSSFPNSSILLQAYNQALKHCHEEMPSNVPVCLFGHCLGGSVLAALLAENHLSFDYDKVVFCSTWLSKLHTTLDKDALSSIASEESEELWDAELKAEDFTSDKKYIDFIENDALAIRKITKNSRKYILDLEKKYHNIQIPNSENMYYIAGCEDKVINLPLALKSFKLLSKGNGTILQLPTDKHYLFFTKSKCTLISWVSSLIIDEKEEYFA